jgi:hypothetical protein
MQPKSTYRPPPGASPTENGSLDTGQLEATAGNKGDQIGAEVISSELDGEEKVVQIRVPINPDLVDQVQVMTLDGSTVNQSREARIIHNYETNNVGIWIRVPTRDSVGFRLKLIDQSDDIWPPVRQQ